MKTLYLIGGTMGVGKTAVCRELKKVLPRCVFLDGDWCWDMDPFVVNEGTKAMVMDNICYLLKNFLKCPELENVVFGWVMHQQEIIDEILGRLELEGCRVIAVSLICTEEALRERIGKDVAAGVRSRDVLERSLVRLPLYEGLQTWKVDTTGKTVGEVAAEIAGSFASGT